MQAYDGLKRDRQDSIPLFCVDWMNPSHQKIIEGCKASYWDMKGQTGPKPGTQSLKSTTLSRYDGSAAM
jgi:hypothetical protein